jgi:hypothetical protein
VGARCIVGRRMAGDAAKEVTGWRRGHESVRVARLAIARAEAEKKQRGEKGTESEKSENTDGEKKDELVFPYGTYGMRVFHGAPVEEQPMEGAIVSAPGPLLEEVLADLRERGRPADPSARAAVMAVMDEVRAAWAEESAEVADHEDLDLDDATRPSRRGAADGEAAPESDAPKKDPDAKPERPEPKVRHRFGRDEDRRGRPHPRRVITKRDRRRRKLRRRGRSDPPC